MNTSTACVPLLACPAVLLVAARALSKSVRDWRSASSAYACLYFHWALTKGESGCADAVVGAPRVLVVQGDILPGSREIGGGKIPQALRRPNRLGLQQPVARVAVHARFAGGRSRAIFPIGCEIAAVRRHLLRITPLEGVEHLARRGDDQPGVSVLGVPLSHLVHDGFVGRSIVALGPAKLHDVIGILDLCKAMEEERQGRHDRREAMADRITALRPPEQHLVPPGRRLPIERPIFPLHPA